MVLYRYNVDVTPRRVQQMVYRPGAQRRTVREAPSSKLLATSSQHLMLSVSHPMTL